MGDDTHKEDVRDLISKSLFEIGGTDQTGEVRLKIEEEVKEGKGKSHLYEHWNAFLKDLQIKVGTLLKSDSVSFLLGAGTSKSAGGVLLGSIPIEIEDQLLRTGVEGKDVNKWIEIFYIAASRFGKAGDNIPKNKNDILDRKNNAKKEPIKVNYESTLSLLYRWRSAFTNGSEQFFISKEPQINVTSKDLDDCLDYAKKFLISQCVLPKSNDPNTLYTHKTFLKKILTRPLNLKRANVFTLNYDTLIEQAADAEGIVLIDGFVGAIRRIFRPESYDQDLYFPAETTEGRVHRLDRVIHLLKLHGSINWYAEEPDWDNPYGVSVQSKIGKTALIYPTPAKYGETLGMPYSELFRRFAWAIVKPQSTLFVMGYGFGDEHVSAIIRQALTIPSFTLVIVDPYIPAADSSSSNFVARLRSQKDNRVWIISKETLGTFDGFVKHVLPDLRDEEILEKVMKTYKALRAETRASAQEGEGHAK
jgi:hypothetical protein